ncbi:MAG: hypothetical protein QOH03_2105 [Kribbellaceae bacterium]|jgi:hypothetical protein|nr:hypothetical protein [Kribbellaceae bacterium]
MRGLPRATSILIWITALAQVLLAVAAWRDYAVFKDDLASWDPGAIRPADLIYLVPAVVTAIVFIVWLRRARDAAEAVNPWFQHRHGRGWVIGGWLVPIISFWYPLQVVEDIIEASTPQIPAGTTPWRPQPQDRLVYIWWVTWVASMLIDNLPLGPDEGPAVSDFFWGALNSTATAVLTVVCAVYAVRVIRLITDLQASRPADELAPGLPPFQH